MKNLINADVTFEIACVCSAYGRGTESAIIKKFNLTKGFVYHLFTGKGRQDIIDRYKNTSDAEIKRIGEQKFQEWDLQSYFDTYTIKPKYHNLLRHYNIAD